MKKLTLAVLLLTGISMSVVAQSTMKKEKTVMVGGAAMYPSKNIVENAVNSKDHTTLVAAVQAAGLVETLQGAWNIQSCDAVETACSIYLWKQ